VARAVRRAWPRRARPAAGRTAALESRAVAGAFAWMFSGARLPAPRLLDLVLDLVPVAATARRAS
jgi:hypothetical protein